MTRFATIYKLDAYKLFASTLRHGRHGLESAYNEAFAAYNRCTDLTNEWTWAAAGLQVGIHDTFNLSGAFPEVPQRTAADIERLHADAYAEDLAADFQASVVMLFVDDALQRFAKATLKIGIGIDPAFGPSYNGVKLTALLRATTNAIRHKSEWADGPLTKLGDIQMGSVYPALDALRQVEKAGRDRDRIRAMENIDILQRALFVGVHERINDVPSMRVLIAIDGQLGPGSVTDYQRFEKAVISAAIEIAQAADEADPSTDSVQKLQDALR